MTAKNAPPSATASLTQNSVTIERKRLEGWYAKVLAVANRLGRTDVGRALAVVAGEMAMSTLVTDHIGRTLSDVDADIAATDLRIVEARTAGESIRSLRLDRARLEVERADRLLRQAGVSPEDVGIVALASHDHRQGRFEVVTKVHGGTQTLEVTETTFDLLLRQRARGDAGFTF